MRYLLRKDFLLMIPRKSFSQRENKKKGATDTLISRRPSIISSIQCGILRKRRTLRRFAQIYQLIIIILCERNTIARSPYLFFYQTYVSLYKALAPKYTQISYSLDNSHNESESNQYYHILRRPTTTNNGRKIWCQSTPKMKPYG